MFGRDVKSWEELLGRVVWKSCWEELFGRDVWKRCEKLGKVVGKSWEEL